MFEQISLSNTGLFFAGVLINWVLVAFDFMLLISCIRYVGIKINENVQKNLQLNCASRHTKQYGTLIFTV